MNVIAVTQKGLNKTENEDRIIVGKTIVAAGTLISEIENGIIAVVDGVGGHNAGAIASHSVANKLCYLQEISVERLKAINDELIKISETTDGQQLISAMKSMSIGSVSGSNTQRYIQTNELGNVFCALSK